MKLSYFDQPEHDGDDALLRNAIDLGHVPPGCLLGGALVSGEVSVGRDPCASCRGPRERCAGRPLQGDAGPMRGAAKSGDDADARRVTRAANAKTILELVTGKRHSDT